MSDAQRIASAVHAGLEQAGGQLSKPILRKLSGAVSAVLLSKSVNTNEIASCLPIETSHPDHRWQWLNRLLGNDLLDPWVVMRPLNIEMLREAHAGNEVVKISIDQSSIRGKPGVEQELVLVSLRVGKRSYPLVWLVQRGAGGIGFDSYKKLLDQVVEQLQAAGIAPGSVMLLGDRFYGSIPLIRYCQGLGWQYRLRLRSDLNIDAGIWAGKTGDLASMGSQKRKEALQNPVLLCEEALSTYVGYLWEEGHPEPWIIAMDQAPTRQGVLEYGHRWSIEALFSDYKTRNFGLGKSQIQRPDKLQRLILLLSLAIWWLIRIGYEEKKKTTETSTDPASHSSRPDTEH